GHASPYSESYAPSLHDALPIYEAGHAHRVEHVRHGRLAARPDGGGGRRVPLLLPGAVLGRAGEGGRRLEDAAGRSEDQPEIPARSEEHTSELQSRENLVCRLLL